MATPHFPTLHIPRKRSLFSSLYLCCGFHHLCIPSMWLHHSPLSHYSSSNNGQSCSGPLPSCFLESLSYQLSYSACVSCLSLSVPAFPVYSPPPASSCFLSSPTPLTKLCPLSSFTLPSKQSFKFNPSTSSEVALPLD